MKPVAGILLLAGLSMGLALSAGPAAQGGAGVDKARLEAEPAAPANGTETQGADSPANQTASSQPENTPASSPETTNNSTTENNTSDTDKSGTAAGETSQNSTTTAENTESVKNESTTTGDTTADETSQNNTTPAENSDSTKNESATSGEPSQNTGTTDQGTGENTTTPVENPDTSKNNSTTTDDSDDKSDNSTTTNNESSDDSTNSSGSNSTDPDSSDSSPTEPDDSLSCPVFTCTNISTSDCFIESSSDHYELSECPSSQVCASVSFEDPEPGSCVNASAPEPYTCKARTQNIANCSVDIDCRASHYCEQGTCVARLPEDSTCSRPAQCEKGTICSQGRCVEYFSVKAAGLADHLLACASGILENGRCQPAQVTNGTLPRPCARDSDCVAADGVTAGKCVCAYDEKASAYCTLHRSDKIALKHLEVCQDGTSEAVEFWTFVYNNYPQVTEANQCYLKVAEELVKFEELKEKAEMCSFGRIIPVIFGVLGVIAV
jgi:hypothetical protein